MHSLLGHPQRTGGRTNIRRHTRKIRDKCLEPSPAVMGRERAWTPAADGGERRPRLFPKSREVRRSLRLVARHNCLVQLTVLQKVRFVPKNTFLPTYPFLFSAGSSTIERSTKWTFYCRPKRTACLLCNCTGRKMVLAYPNGTDLVPRNPSSWFSADVPFRDD